MAMANLPNTSTFSITKKLPELSKSCYKHDLFKKCVEISHERDLSEGYSSYDQKVLKTIEKNHKKRKIITPRSKVFAEKSIARCSIAGIKKTSRSLSINRAKKLFESPARKRKGSQSTQSENFLKDMKTCNETQEFPSTSITSRFKEASSKIAATASSKLCTSKQKGSIYSLEQPSSSESLRLLTRLEFEGEDYLKPPPEFHSLPLPKLRTQFASMETSGLNVPIYESWSSYVATNQEEASYTSFAHKLSLTASLSKLKKSIKEDPTSIVRQAFVSPNPSKVLESVMKSERSFFSMEWLTFFICLRKYSIYFLDSTGSLGYLLLAFACLEKLSFEKISMENRYSILVDFALAIYKFAYEIKFRYSVGDDIVYQFHRVQKVFWSIVVAQSYDPRDNDFFKHLSILSYAALQTNIGFPERAKGKLQDFCDILSLGAQLGEHCFTRGFIVSLYFHQLTLAMEKDLTLKVDYEKLKNPIKNAYDYFYKCFNTKKILFPFYGFVIRDYVRVLWNLTRRTSKNPYLLSLYITLKERNHYSDDVTCQLLILLVALASSIDEFQTVENCEKVFTPDLFLIKNESLKCHFLSYIFQLVIDIIPFLTQNRMYDRATNLLDSTHYYLKHQLKNVKRVAFISSLFVHTQYDAVEDGDASYNRAVQNIWNELWGEIKPNKTLKEAKYYLYFAGTFHADLLARGASNTEGQEVLMKLQELEFYSRDRWFCSFLRPVNTFQMEIFSNTVCTFLYLTFDDDMKIRIYWAVGGDRLFHKNEILLNSVTRTWSSRLGLPLLTQI